MEYKNHCDFSSGIMEEIIWSERGYKNGYRYSYAQKFVNSDGGRESAGFKGIVGDCVCRAIAIATEQSYKKVYNDLLLLAKLERSSKKRKRSHPRSGVNRITYEAYLKSLGWKWKSCMQIGSGCKVHLRGDELPNGKIIARLSRHLVAVVDGVIHDTYDCSREGSRCVYGYFYC